MRRPCFAPLPACLLAFALGCAAPVPSRDAGKPPVLSKRPPFARHVGKRVTVFGRAESNYKDGAIDVARDDERVRVAGHTKWPAEFAGRTVAATGGLTYQPYDPALDHVAYAADVLLLWNVKVEKAVVVDAPATDP